MTIVDDDDLPVLTQVLRTGDGRLPPSAAMGAEDTRGRSSDAQRTGADDDPPWPRALVIGSDPDAQDGEAADVWRDASSIRRGAAPMADDPHPGSRGAVATPGGDVGSHDVFLRSAPPDAAFVDSIDEPPLIDRHGSAGAADEFGAPSGSAVLAALSRDVPLAFGPATTAPRDHDATLVLQVRDSVLQELSARIDTELDARIAQTLHAALEGALAQLQGSLRIELAEALRDVVGRAVDDAVRRLRDEPPAVGGR